MVHRYRGGSIKGAKSKKLKKEVKQGGEGGGEDVEQGEYEGETNRTEEEKVGERGEKEKPQNVEEGVQGGGADRTEGTFIGDIGDRINSETRQENSNQISEKVSLVRTPVRVKIRRIEESEKLRRDQDGVLNKGREGRNIVTGKMMTERGGGRGGRVRVGGRGRGRILGEARGGGEELGGAQRGMKQLRIEEIFKRKQERLMSRQVTPVIGTPITDVTIKGGPGGPHSGVLMKSGQALGPNETSEDPEPPPI